MATRLPLDILVYITSHIKPRSDLVRYARSCRFLYNATLSHLLACDNIIVELDELSSFCDLVLYDFPNRCNMLTNLQLYCRFDGEIASKQTIGNLIKVLSNAKMLVRLIIHDQKGFRTYLELKPTTLGDLISTSTQLQLLQLHSTEEIDTLHVLHTTKAPLADLNFSFYQHAKGYSLPVKLLEPFSETLAKLVVDCDIILSTEIKLPNVHSLELPIMRHGLSLQALIETFPSIQTLDLYIPEIMPLAWMTQMRERNRAVDCSMWSNLFAVTGPLDALFSIGISSSTFHLAIDGIAPSNADRVGAILRDTTPRHLALSFDDMTAHCDLQTAELESFVSKEVAEKLEVVILDIPLRVELSDENPLSLLNMHRLVKILKPPYLILNIVIHIHDDLTPPTPSSPYNNYLLPKNFFDIHSIALEMSAEKSSLRYIRITTTLLCDSYNFSSETLENLWHVCPDSTLTELPMKLTRGLENPKLVAAARMERLYLYQVKVESSLQETAV